MKGVLAGLAALVVAPVLVVVLLLGTILGVQPESAGGAPPGAPGGGTGGGLKAGSVPANLVAPINKAASYCAELSPALIAAQIWVESGFRNVTSPNGAAGYSQFMPPAWAEMGQDHNGDGKADVLDPEDSIPTQGQLMCKIISQIRGWIKAGKVKTGKYSLLSLALTGYNGGPGVVLKYSGPIPTSEENKRYAPKVFARVPYYSGVALGGGMSCRPSGSPAEKGLQPNALRVLRCVKQNFPKVPRFSGVGPRPTNPDSDHPKGLAVDVWSGEAFPGGYRSPEGKAYGWQIARWVEKHAASLGVTYVLFWDREWRPGKGWFPYRHPSGATDDSSAHRDHPHISVKPGDVGGGAPGGGGVPGKSGKYFNPLGSQEYRLTSGVGPRPSPCAGCSSYHKGQDMAGPIGLTIYSACDGVVRLATTSLGGLGLATVVDCPSQVRMFYGHQSAQSVQTGQRVKAGQPIGKLGNSGRSSGPHLHFEIHSGTGPSLLGGRIEDPLKFMKARGVQL